MTHEIYRTEGIVLGYYDTGEADRVYSIFTEQFGRLMARATSVRLTKSKLRTNLYNFAHVDIGFVRGKYSITITDAREILRPQLLNWSENTTLFAILSAFVCRMIPCEKNHPAIWDELMCVMDSLNTCLHNTDELRRAEAVFKVRVLTDLGYIPEVGDKITLPTATALIEQAVRESQL